MTIADFFLLLLGFLVGFFGLLQIGKKLSAGIRDLQEGSWSNFWRKF